MSDDPRLQDWIAVHASRDQRELRDLILVLESRGLTSAMQVVDGVGHLLVPAAQVAPAREELRAYRLENVRPVGGERSIAMIASGWPGVCAYAAVLVAIGLLASEQAFDLDWFVAGRADAAAMRGGEWWRMTTALTLHADLAHLAGNLLFGSCFGFFVAQYCGFGVGWAAIVLGGSIGNAVNALAHPGGHLSLGASTAVFAALGLLVALVWHRGFLRNTPWRRRFAPIFAGIALLAYTGTAGDNTDLGAHLFGFLAGLGLGFLIPREGVLRRHSVQWTAAAVTSAWLVATWSLALG